MRSEQFVVTFGGRGRRRRRRCEKRRFWQRILGGRDRREEKNGLETGGEGEEERRERGREEWIGGPRIGLEFSFVPFSALAFFFPPFSPFFSFFFFFPPRRASPRGTAPRRKKSPIFSSLHFCVICFMERLLQINIIGIHRRVLSPTKRPARRGFYIFSTHPPTHPPTPFRPAPTPPQPIFFVSPPPPPRPAPPPPAPSHQHRAVTATATATAATTIAGLTHAVHTRALIFIIRVFWNFSSGAQHCFTVCHCYTPTSCQARERRGL